MIGRILYLALAAVAVHAPFAAQTAAAAPAPQVTVSTEMSAVCDRIAALVVPTEQIESRLNQTLPTLVRQLIESDRELTIMEREFPGLSDAVVAAWRPIMVRAENEMIPQYRAEMADMYCRNFTLPELQEIAVFLQSPAFQALQKSTYQNLSLSRTADDIIDERDISAKSIRGDLADSGAKAAMELSPEQKRTVMTFMSSPLGRKMVGLTQEKLAIDTKWANYAPDWAAVEIEKVTIDAMIAHIAKTDPKLAQEMSAQLTAQNGAAKRN